MTRRCAGDRGSSTIWVLACCALLLVIAGAYGVRAMAVLARHRAESSADLAALAAAGQLGVSDAGCAAAARIAELNGARLRSCTVQLGADGRSGAVTVSVGYRVGLPIVGEREVVASARAGRRPITAADRSGDRMTATPPGPSVPTQDTRLAA